jgi:PTS system fructose-specific IIC component
MRLVAVTSCPTGIAHTYMAAEALEQAAKAAGHEIAVETQGAAGSAPLPPETIAAADAVIFAADVEVRDRDRFAGKPIVHTQVKRAINAAPAVIAEAVTAAGTPAAQPVGDAPPTAPATKVTADASPAVRVRQWLMTGVSYMIPFVAAGGILIALAFMVGGYQVTDTDAIKDFGWAALLFKVGATAFSMLVPILAGFIAYAMADRPGIAPGVVGGLLASEIGAGFLGGIAAGLLAGGIVLLIKRASVPRSLRSLMPVLVIPLVATLAVGFLMIVVVGKPIAEAQTAMQDWLNGLGGSNAVVLGLLLGLMMAFDMGGPVNKVAYTFGLAALAAGNHDVMAAVMAAGMTPPLGLALATVVRRSLFTEPERESGKAAWVLGASFITEGAIPFAAADPLRVIPSLMVGSAVTGALSMAFGSRLQAPHGGIFVVGLVGRPLLYLVAIAAGTAVTAAAVIAAKSFHRPPAVIDLRTATTVDDLQPAH